MISQEALERAAALQAELGWDEFSHPTPDQLLTFLRRCDDETGIDLVTKFLTARNEAERCFIENHRRALDYWKSRAATAPDTLT